MARNPDFNASMTAAQRVGPASDESLLIFSQHRDFEYPGPPVPSDGAQIEGLHHWLEGFNLRRIKIESLAHVQSIRSDQRGCDPLFLKIHVVDLSPAASTHHVAALTVAAKS